MNVVAAWGRGRAVLAPSCHVAELGGVCIFVCSEEGWVDTTCKEFNNLNGRCEVVT